MMKRDLSHQRCFNHAEREAAARCPGCRQFFCRECITEHDDRVICANCLRKLTRVPLFKRRGWINVVAFGQCFVGFLVAWLFFYLVGESLLALPASFHEGAFWRVEWWHQK
jgi:hypothetical protein